MGVYGVGVYGQTLFGYDAGQIQPPGFSADPFRASLNSYTSQTLTWTRPQSQFCSRLRLIKNNLNIPTDVNDGQLVFEQPNAITTMYTDSSVVSGFAYYSLFGLDTDPTSPDLNHWVRCSDLVTLVPVRWGYGDIYYDSLPELYRIRDYVLSETANPDPDQQNLNPPLQRFLGLVGFQMDILRTEIESLLLVTDPHHCSGNLLPLIAQQLGMVYEQEIGMTEARSLIYHAVHLYKQKGTPVGIKDFTSELTGYPVSSVEMGINRLPYFDDSVAAKGIGSWAVASGNSGTNTLSSVNLLSLYPSMPLPTAILGIVPKGYSNTGFQIRSTAGSPINASYQSGLVPMSDFVDNTGVGSFNFNVLLFTPPAGSARTVVVSVIDDLGNSYGQASFTTVINSWRVATVTGNLTNPTGNFLKAVVTIQSMAPSEVQHFTFAGFYNQNPLPIVVAPQLRYYDYPRDLKINITPLASNLLGNPLTTFFNGIDGWKSDQRGGSNTLKFAIAYIEPGDTTGAFGQFGIGSLQVTSTGFSNPVLYGGLPPTFTAQPVPAGWSPEWTTGIGGDWFGGAQTIFSGGNKWFDAQGWFFQDPGEYFESTSSVASGDWFEQNAWVPGTVNAIVPQVDTPYTFSVFLRTAGAISTTVQLGLQWTFADGSTVTTNSQVTLTGLFARYSVSGLTPFDSYGNPAVGLLSSITFLGAQQGDTYLVNAAMISPTPGVTDYFDTYLNPGNADYEVSAHGSSFYFPHESQRIGRLDVLLPNWIPMGATYTLILATPGT